MHSAIYSGEVRHRRHSPKPHHFNYSLYMLALDLDELDELDNSYRFFSQGSFTPLSFHRKDYLFNPDLELKTETLNTINKLGGNNKDINKVILVCQVRCFGLYFSPVNFYFCYQNQSAKYMIAEVRSTPWNEKHCYLVDINTPKPNQKELHVSPFMGMDMEYRWRIDPPKVLTRNKDKQNQNEQLMVHIENWNSEKVFDATVNLKHQKFSSKVVLWALKQWPLMTFSIVRGIYWQALKLFFKAVPFHSHPKHDYPPLKIIDIDIGENMETSYPRQGINYWQRLARKQLFSVLNQLDNVGIEITDHEGCYFFGDEQAHLQADIRINDLRFYTRVVLGGGIAAGETWSEGLWESNKLSNVIRVFARCEKILDKLEKRTAWITYPITKARKYLSRNSLAGSRSNISAHYDLGNSMYKTFLDPLMQYSSAIFKNSDDSLEQAQIHKLDRICQKLSLKEGDHLLEIGTGWGGLAFYAAKHYGCTVTTTTISKEQFELAKQRISDAGLNHKVTLLLKDYRKLEGKYDKVVSIEMIEAVGHQYLPTYFKKINELLKPDGQLLIQAITIADQRYNRYKNNVDFIQRYIFPGGCLPSINRMTEQLSKQTDMTLTTLSSHGHDYAKTLQHWDNRFKHNSQILSKIGYDAYFQRLWAFYFGYCEGGFLEGCIDLVHLHASKPGARVCKS